MLELEKLRESTGLDRRKTNELLLSIFREVNGVSSILSPKSDEWVPLSSSSSSTSATPPPEVTDEDFTRVRVQLSNMRCEARSLTEQRAILEQAEREAKEKAQALMKEVANCKLKLSQVYTIFFSFPFLSLSKTLGHQFFTHCFIFMQSFVCTAFSSCGQGIQGCWLFCPSSHMKTEQLTLYT